MDWLQSIDWMGILKCFVTGGLICVIGQILVDKTKLTPARILVYDRGGKKFKVFNYSTVIYERTLKNNIYSADISRDGKCAFVTDSNSHSSELFVYDDDQELIYNWKCAGNLLSSVSFNESGTKVATAEIFTEGGILSSKVNLFNASILGGTTVIGRECTIGSNVFITHSIPCCTTVTVKSQELQMKSRSCTGDCEKCQNKVEPFWEDQK